jgi:HAD superfamily hydrolase (TIGR01509 family)
MRPRVPAAIFFDVMDTLVRDPFHHEMPAFFGMTRAELIRVKHPTAWVDFELGRIDEPAFLSLFLPGRAWDRAGFCDHVRASYEWLPGMEALLADLRAAAKETRLCALSNYPPWYRWIDERCGLSRYLDAAFVSYETGVRKPAPEAYLLPCRRLGIAPGEALFVDDRGDNCEAARAVGMDAIVFRDAGALREELARRGVLIRTPV